MQLKDIELSACKSKPMPKFLTLPEMCLYISLRYLYKSWHKGEIAENDAKVEKQKILGEYERYKTAYVDWCKVYSDYQDNIRKAGTLLSDIEKSEDISEIAVTACKVIGIMTGDESFIKRQERKFEKK